MPGALVNPKVSYGDANTQVRSVIDVFELQSFTKFPLLKLISGGSDEAPALNNLDVGNGRWNARKLEWMDEALPPLSTLTTASIATTGATTINVTAADGLHLTKGTEILIESERMLVTTAGDATGAVVVSRAYHGTTAATHTTVGTPVYIIGRGTQEGTATDLDYYTYPDMYYNVVQQFREQFQLTSIEQAIKRYGTLRAGTEAATDEYNKQRIKKTLKAMRDLHLSCYYGTRTDGAAGVIGTMGGVETFIDSGNVFSLSGAALQRADVNKALRLCAIGTGEIPTHIIVGGFLKQKISSIYEAVPTRYDAPNASGGIVVDRIMTDFGPIDVLFDPFCKTDQVYGFNVNYMGVGPLDGNDFQVEPLAKTGDFDPYQIRGVYTLMMRMPKKHFLIQGVSNVS